MADCDFFGDGTGEVFFTLNGNLTDSCGKTITESGTFSYGDGIEDQCIVNPSPGTGVAKFPVQGTNTNIMTETISFWVNIPSTSTTTTNYISYFGSGGSNAFTYVGFTSIFDINVYMNAGDVSSTLTPDIWTHIVAVFDGVNGCQLYINGEYIGNGGTSTSLVNINYCSINGNFDNTLYGNSYSLDYYRLINKAVTAEEALELYNEYQPPIVDKPIFGTSEIDTFMLGSTQVDKVMLGSELLWEGTPPELGCDPFGDGSGIVYDKFEDALYNECQSSCVGSWLTEEGLFSDGGIKDSRCAGNFLIAHNCIKYGNINLCTSGSKTYTFWVKIEAYTPSLPQTFWVYEYTTSGSDLYMYGNGDMYLDRGTGTYAMPINEWVLVSVVTDTTANTTNVYFNGYLKLERPSVIEPAPTPNDFIFVGGDGYYNSKFVNGYIDDLRLFNKALTEAEIEVLYNDGISTNKKDKR